jgi:hypothetical protein
MPCCQTQRNPKLFGRCPIHIYTCTPLSQWQIYVFGFESRSRYQLIIKLQACISCRGVPKQPQSLPQASKLAKHKGPTKNNHTSRLVRENRTEQN